MRTLPYHYATIKRQSSCIKEDVCRFEGTQVLESTGEYDLRDLVYYFDL